MRSEILGFTIEEMAAIRIAFRKGSYYSAFASYAEGGPSPELKEKCAAALASIASWKELCRILPLEELVWELMISTGFYIAAGAMPAGSQRQANLRALVDKAAGWRRSQDGSLYGFIQYISAVKEKKVPMGQVKMAGEDEDTVRIMTIHKSKGLEFPMVLLAGYCRRLNYTAAGKGITIHKDIGIGFPLINYGQSWYRTTILQNVINHRMHREEVEEEKRILYVAMTRARDVLNFLGIMDDVDGGVEKILAQPPKDSSYFNMTGSLICGWGGSWEEITNGQLAGISRARRRQAGRIASVMEAKPVPVSDDILSRLTFEYPAKDELYRKSKYSVSELAFGDYGKGSSSAELPQPAFMSPDTGFTAAQTGTFTHKVLEKMDFARASQEGMPYIEKLVGTMVEDQFLTEEEGSAVDLGKLAEFACGPLGQRIAASPAVFREKPFNLLYEAGGKEVLVQGIIDCFFEEDGELVLTDYKTTNIRDKAEFERRKEEIAERYRLQMDIYRRALEESRGMKVKEANLVLTNIGEIIKI